MLGEMLECFTTRRTLKILSVIPSFLYPDPILSFSQVFIVLLHLFHLPPPPSIPSFNSVFPISDLSLLTSSASHPLTLYPCHAGFLSYSSSSYFSFLSLSLLHHIFLFTLSPFPLSFPVLSLFPSPPHTLPHLSLNLVKLSHVLQNI